ncbi:YhcH/YjgK/YiaL family protein [Nibricoccus sp. IMCC34717]|uniref:YhcH/YjgK/YiaL family protein n=1 Tax=Nibricoccus sp. IMCC34717 TaxID=3034021 RepID=UPI00384CC7BD
MAIFGPLAHVRAQTSAALVPPQAWLYLEAVANPSSDAQARIRAMEAGVEHRVDLGGGVFALEQANIGRAREAVRFEGHVRHLDLQFVVVGREIMDVEPVARLQVAEDHTPGRDVKFFAEPATYSTLRIEAGEVAVFLPADGHRPSVGWDAGARIFKTVVKVPVA